MLKFGGDKIQTGVEIEERENILATRFDSGDCECKLFEANEINSIKNTLAVIFKIITEGKMFEKEIQEYTEDEKVKILKEVLISLSKRLGGEYSKTQEEIS